ncbi:hypothetical protein [Asaia astilbis]|uniref:hypothetical protein n=1 Tax=Asaia astilbis TaxID=610244 RepID=UPI000470F507|nr:hypothetical protein [Asaia astilbis]
MIEAEQRLDGLLISELTTPIDHRLHVLVAKIIEGGKPLAVLFYGSGLRQFDPEGLFDFYIVLDTLSDWRGPALLRLGNRLLPPNVYYVEEEVEGQTLRAKIAVLTLAQFRAAASPRSNDTTLWARFCQPVRLVWVRDPGAADSCLEVIRRCVVTAAGWAARLENGAHTPDEWWQALFRRTYRAELRVERSGRGSVIMQGQEARYAALTADAWLSAGLVFTETEGLLAPRLSERQRSRAQKRWDRMARQGRWRNIARLIKASFTFRDGARYLAWKIERHSGFSLHLSAFEARHPLICLPVLLWRARVIFLRGMRR